MIAIVNNRIMHVKYIYLFLKYISLILKKRNCLDYVSLRLRISLM